MKILAAFPKRLLAMISLVTFCFAGTADRANSEGGLLISAYFYPDGGGVEDRFAQLAWAADWLETKGTLGYNELIAIINVFNGPGTAADPNYANAISVVQASGGKMIGYVATGYGQTSLTEIIDDINAWLLFYPNLNGIFLDEWAGNQKLHSAHYREIYRYVTETLGLPICIGNPGVSFALNHIAPRPAEWGTQFVVHENSFTSGTGFVLPRWLQTRPHSTKGTVLVHGMPMTGDVNVDHTTAMLKIMEAKQKGARWFYLTDDIFVQKGDNPWDSLPGENATGLVNEWNPYWGNLIWSIGSAHP